MGSLRYSESTISYDMVSLGERLKNAVVSYSVYAGKMIWPSGLAMFHPYKLALPWWQVGLSSFFLCSLTAGAVLMVKKRPYLLFGWLWFLGTLVPVSGIAQVGLWPAWAERWAYVPYVGLFVIVCWGGHDLVRGWGINLKASAAVAALFFGCLTYAGYRQAMTWENDLTLYTSSVRGEEENFVAHNNLGAVLLSRKRAEEALPHLHEALRINPRFPFPHLSLGLYYSELKQLDDAEQHLAKCVSLEPRSASGHFSLAEVYQKKGNVESAFLHYREALKLNPYEKRNYNNLGVLCLQVGQTEGAIKSFLAALKLDPEFGEAHNNLGFAYLRSGQIELATQHLQKALALDPGNPMALESLKEAQQARLNG
jgi:Tfp pilus assembly protein PilF